MIRLGMGGAAITDGELEALLWRVYVEEGFTDGQVAKKALSAGAVRARGELLVAFASTADSAGEVGRGSHLRGEEVRGEEVRGEEVRGEEVVAGMVMVVLPTSAGRRIAGPSEGELHLLAVLPSFRGLGIGGRLVDAAVEFARDAGLERMVLWTQPSMQAAQRLYVAHGFTRRPERDSEVVAPPGRTFWVYEKSLRETRS